MVMASTRHEHLNELDDLESVITWPHVDFHSPDAKGDGRSRSNGVFRHNRDKRGLRAS